MESLDEGAAEISDLDDDPLLCLQQEEPEAWSNAVDKKILKKLKEKEIKRQEIIHELIITEKHHCLTLKIMKKVFAEGMLKELHMLPKQVERIFPCLEELLDFHLSFLRRLCERRAIEPVVENISDIILHQFHGATGEQMRIYYGEFCSQHKEALSCYKEFLKTDPKFSSFIKRCCSKPLCKTRGVPECILLVTQRITKYPLLIESLIKVTKENKEDFTMLTKSLTHIKDVINRVNNQVAEKEREIRLLEIYNKIDAKSTANFRKKKFRKSDLLSNNRKLRYECVLSVISARSKPIEICAVILSDVILFLQENNQKYHFFSFDSKSGVVSLQKLLVREKAGQSRAVYLISSNPQPEMYELTFPTDKSQKNWIDEVRDAVENCPEEDEGVPSECEERKIEEAKKAKVRELLNSMYEKDCKIAKMCEEKMKIFADMMELLGIDQEGLEMISYAQMVEENCSPEAIVNAANEAFRIAHNLYVSGTNLSRSCSSAGEHHSEQFVSPILPKRAETFGGFDNPDKSQTALKRKLMQLKEVNKDDNLEQTSSNESTVSVIQAEPNEIVTSEAAVTSNPESFLQVRALEVRRSSGGSMTKKSVSGQSSPEKYLQQQIPIQRRSLVTTLNLQAVAQVTPLPTVPQQRVQHTYTPSNSSSTLQIAPLYDPNDIYRLTTTPLLMTQGKDQLIQIAELQHQVNTLMCLFNCQQTLFEKMRMQLADANEKASKLSKENTSSSFSSSSSKSKSDRRLAYRPEHQLEELRNLQEQLSMEKQEWLKKQIEERTWIDSERNNLNEFEERLRKQQKDVEEQRSHLYRKLEALQREGIVLSPASNLVVGGGNTKISQTDLDIKSLSSTPPMSLQNKNRNSLVLTGEKDSQPEISISRRPSNSTPVKQQIPFKLAESGDSTNTNQQIATNTVTTSGATCAASGLPANRLASMVSKVGSILPSTPI